MLLELVDDSHPFSDSAKFHLLGSLAYRIASLVFCSENGYRPIDLNDLGVVVIDKATCICFDKGARDVVAFFNRGGDFKS